MMWKFAIACGIAFGVYLMLRNRRIPVVIGSHLAFTPERRAMLIAAECREVH